MELQESAMSAHEAEKDFIPNQEPAEDTPRAIDENVITEEESLEAGLDTVMAEDAPEVGTPVTKVEVIANAEAIAEKDGADINRDEVSRLKQQFYAIRHAEVEAAKAEFVANGNDAAAFVAAEDADELRFKEVLAAIKEKKNAYLAAIEAARQANFEKKDAIINELIAMADDTDNVNRHFPRFRELQQEFKAVGEVPASELNDQWKRYQTAVERFYDQLKVNKDLRDYDFKKNLDTKILLCEEAEKLDAEDDVITAFKRLQELHDKWRETGPVAKEIREEIWARFKDASAVVNKKYQAFFEGRKQRERENEDAKTAICERVEALDFSAIKSHAAWEEMTRTILAAQEEWKKLGFASRKMNNVLFSRFRGVCDNFFAKKAEYFKNMKDELAGNLVKKTALVERAEALKDSTDWKKVTDEMVALQKEWKTIGGVAKKHSDAIWRRFQDACDYFFEQKKKATSGVRKAEQANLKDKRAVIEEIKAIPEGTSREDAGAKVRELMARYQQIGHVPFRDKDKLHEAYRAAVDEAYAKFDLRAAKAHMANFEASISNMGGDQQKLLRERDRMMRALEQKRVEIHTFENNLGFFNSKSKSGDSMMREMERRIQRLREELETIEKKIGLIDSQLS